jgi:hypothetical protein
MLAPRLASAFGVAVNQGLTDSLNFTAGAALFYQYALKLTLVRIFFWFIDR